MSSQEDPPTLLTSSHKIKGSRGENSCRPGHALIIEGHPIVSDSIRAAIREVNPALVVNVAKSLNSALKLLVDESPPLLIVTELMLTDATGIETLRRLRFAAPDSALLVFTVSDDQALRHAAIELGVTKYFVKTVPAKQMQDAIRASLGVGMMVGEISVDSNESEIGLTRRQIEVLEELIAARTNRQIAKRLQISTETVGSHMKEILGRLGTKNRTEAVVRYLKLMSRSK